MSIPQLSELENATRRIVRDGKERGQLSILTPRIIRAEVEKLFALESGTLDTKEYKSALKQAASDEASREDDVDRNTQSSIKKRKSDAQDDLEQAKPGKTTQTKKAKSASSTSKHPKPFKSSDIVPSSDVEEEVRATSGNPASTSAHEAKIHDGSGHDHESPKANNHDSQLAREKQQKTVSQSDIENEANKRTSPKPAVSVVAPKSSVGDKAEASESELSVLLDDPPKGSKKSKNKDKESKKSNEGNSKRQKKAVELSKDEKTITRLKSLVAACGVRKTWTKEFQNLEKTSQQIKRLKEILSDLGMTGRFTLQQAKVIKENRELAQELEDVQSFQQAVVSSGSTRSKAKRTEPESDSEENPERDSAEEGATKPRTTARMSIMAFLGDESE